MTFGIALVALPTACSRARPEHRVVSSLSITSAVSQSAVPPAASSTAPPSIEPLAGPFRVQCSDMHGCLESEVVLYGDPSSHVVESAWAKVKLRPSDRASRLGLEPMLVPLPIPAATRLLEVQPTDDSVYLLLESVAALGQPAGLRALVDVSGQPVVLPRSVQATEVTVLAQPTNTGNDAPWHGVIARESLDELELLKLTKLAPEAQIGPDGLSVEVTWQGVFRERKQLIAAEQLTRWPELSKLQRAVSSLRDELTSGQIYRSGRDPLWRHYAEAPDGSVLWFDNTKDKLSLSAWSRPATAPTAVATSSTDSADSEQALDRQIARLPVSGKVVWRGLWSRSVPIAVLDVEQPRRAFVLFGGTVVALRGIDAVSDASFAHPGGHLEAGLWDRLGDQREELVLRLERPGVEPWIGVYGLAPLTSRPGERGNDSALAFWAHDANSVGDAIVALERVPHRGIPRGAALALLRASQTARGFRANAARTATVFEMSGWYDTGGGAPLRKNPKQRDDLSDEKLRWLDTLGDWGKNASCATFECAKDAPYCYCHAPSMGITDHFWFEQRDGRWVIVGIGVAGTD
ncbi:MAG TPA: hypothetical protein VER96_01990 [Polyangiaceae bacterium]|nr:hypothetical protein [Polyangiaceae bacterium]